MRRLPSNVLTTAFVLMFLVALPYVFALRETPAGGVYTGLHALTPGDFNVYYTQMRLAAEGTMFTLNPYAGIDGAGSVSMVNHFWWLLGKIALLSHLPIPLVFHGFRVLLVPLLVIVGYRLVTLLVHRADLPFAALFACVGSGVGYFVIPFLRDTVVYAGRYEWPTDVWVPESNTFLTLYHSPHLLASLLLMLVILACFLEAMRSPRFFLWSIGGGAALSALLLFHPFHAPTLACVLTGWSLLFWRTRARAVTTALLLYALCAAPVLWWHLSRLGGDWIVWEWARQNITPTPSPLMVAIGYGALIPLAGYGIFRARRLSAYRTGDDRMSARAGLLLMVWLFVHCVLIYSPLSFQRRLMEGMHVPLAFLAGIGAAPLFRILFARDTLRARFALVGILLLVCFSTVGTLARDLALFQSQDPLLYFDAGDRAMLAAVSRAPSGVVLAGMNSSNIIPAWADRTVWGAPGAFSPGYWDVRYPMIEWYISGAGTQDQRVAFLHREHITSVVIARIDHLDSTPLLADPHLQLVYDQEGTRVFYVR